MHTLRASYDELIDSTMTLYAVAMSGIIQCALASLDQKDAGALAYALQMLTQYPLLPLPRQIQLALVTYRDTPLVQAWFASEYMRIGEIRDFVPSTLFNYNAQRAIFIADAYRPAWYMLPITLPAAVDTCTSPEIVSIMRARLEACTIITQLSNTLFQPCRAQPLALPTEAITPLEICTRSPREQVVLRGHNLYASRSAILTHLAEMQQQYTYL